MFKKTFFLLLAAGLFYFWPLIASETTARSSKDLEILPSNPDAAFTVRVWTDRSAVMPGEQVTIYFSSTQDCYLTLVNRGTSGKQTVIFPNPWSGADNFVRADRDYSFPPSGASFRFNVQGPDGVETVLAYATLGRTPIQAVLQLNQRIPQGQMLTIRNKNFKDLVAEDAGRLSKRAWSTAAAQFRIGAAPVSAPILTPAPRVPKESPYYILSIGASTSGLVGCEKDANEFAQTAAARLNVPALHIKLLTAGAATVQGIRQGFNWLRGETDADSKVLVFFSGHGSYIADRNGDEADGYDEVLVPFGCVPDDASTFIIDDEFNAWIRKLPCSDVLVMIDACHSGTMTKSFGVTPKFFRGGLLGQPRGNTFITKGAVKEESGTETLLAASREEQTAIEKDGRGLFTVQFCAAINNGAATFYDAFKQARKQVLIISENQQEPVIFGPDRFAHAIQMR